MGVWCVKDGKMERWVDECIDFFFSNGGMKSCGSWFMVRSLWFVV